MERTEERKRSFNRELQGVVRDVWLNNQIMPSLFPYVPIDRLRDEDINQLLNKLEKVANLLFEEQFRRKNEASS